MIALEEIQSTKRNCDQCNHTLESQKESLKQPSIIFQSRTIETHLYPCETCEFTSISREDMTAHAKSRESYQSMWICCYVSRKYWCKYRGSSWDWTTWKFFMWPMRLWNNFPGQPTSAWMWRYQHSTQPFNTVLMWPMRLQVTSWIIWFVLDISYIWIIWFDYKYFFDDLICFIWLQILPWMIWFDLIWQKNIID